MEAITLGTYDTPANLNIHIHQAKLNNFTSHPPPGIIFCHNLKGTVMKVQIALDKDVQMPRYSRVGDAAMDLRAHLPQGRMAIGVGRTKLVPTGIRIAVPEGHAALILPRSGLACKGITVMNAPGLIDSNYRGEIQVILHNAGDDTFVIENGDRIAQLLILPIPTIEWDAVADLDDTNRGAQGFGSSGVK